MLPSLSTAYPVYSYRGQRPASRATFWCRATLSSAPSEPPTRPPALVARTYAGCGVRVLGRGGGGDVAWRSSDRSAAMPRQI